jgi:hypothetical protein
MKTGNKPKRTRDGHYPDHIAQDGEEIHHPLYLADGYRRDLVQSFGAVPDLSLHQSGYRVADQATRDSVSSARNEMIARAESGWRLDKRREPPDGGDDDDNDNGDDEDRLRREDRRSADGRSLADIRAGAIKAREAWVRSLSDAWRTPAATLPAYPETRTHGRPGPDAGYPTRDAAAGPGPAATLSAGGVPDDPQKRRDEAWNRWRDEQQNAWRSVGPGPSVVGASSSYKGAGS